ncbi:hypothetical protein I6U48_14060 [Clostridium sp. PL3]|uniref:Uncharacterized protein n=1 Tax=Clostridium thailandense TaxID=2794346 RepID=A0A949WVS7_9CLOT|nr:hypothetical protein [Clostridium thailandense]MBV7274027.1 hypothetical protein [Clostridium thailandense]
MGLFSRSSGKRHHGDSHRGSNYYKREGLLSRIMGIFDSFSSSGRRYNKYCSHNSHHSHQNHYSDQKYGKKRYKSSWS